ncbi:26S proteasome non-ATPase regulatory subunit 2 [Aphelenchoides besseyi]|nr:26S proteasome non-ATPase regulatory subunit 2 [Aphelenchoides besseyi]KAI6217367.1 26S proteasome non-ATPase regulatory subunit 2 [Aphelenchoides besseyi]
MVLEETKLAARVDDNEKTNKDEKQTTGKRKEREEKPVELSDEDKKLKEDLEVLIARLQENDENLYLPSLESMRGLIRASTTSMTSVPKPLKFMLPHYTQMKQVFEKMGDTPAKRLCADIISVLAMCSDNKSDCINFRLKGMHEPIGDWGHEYVRHLAMEMAEEWRLTADGSGKSKERREELLTLIKDIVQHNMKHNAEVEACDLLLEIEKLNLLLEYVEDVDHARVCLYLLSCAPLTPDPDNQILIRTAKDLYLKFDKQFDALRCAVILNDIDLIRDIFGNCKDLLIKRQMAILLGRQQVFLDLEDQPHGDVLAPLNSNTHLFQYFHSLARELDIMEPKTPDGVYKTHLEQTRPFGGATNADSKRMNLAASFVNGFVNCGFGVDKMLGDAESANRWFCKNQEYGIFSAAASLGLIYRWDIDKGLVQCDQFLYVNDDYIRAGTLLAIGIISSGVQNSCDPAAALLMDHVHSERACMSIGSILGLGLAYANSKRETVVKDEEGGVIYELKKVLADQRPSVTPEIKGMAGLSLGFILVGTGDHTVAMEMLQVLMERSEIELTDPNMRFLALGIALVFLGTQERSEVFVESLRSLPEPFGSMVSTLVDVCAYAGTGNVLKIQRLLHICSEHYEGKEEKKKDDKNKKNKEENKDEKPDLSAQQAVAVLGIGLIAMGEDIGSQMSMRVFGHLIRYGEPVIRRAVPLALALCSVSNPQLNILETLSKFSHDADNDTAHNAIFAMGLVGAGTNNARLVAMLRQLASYHHKDQVSLMLVRIAQGLTHMGKGTMTLNPFHSDRQLMSPAAVAAVFSVCFAFLDANNSILNNRQHYLLFNLVLAMQPRLLITLVEDPNDSSKLKQVNVTVRVGQAVDVVAQAGRPKTITGFQTHTTPVLLAYGERAELATDEYLPVTPFLEGLVILKKNPDSEMATK